MKIYFFLLTLLIHNITCTDFRFFMFDSFGGGHDPLFKQIIAYVGTKVSNPILMVDKETKDGDLLPVIFIDDHGRQSDLLFFPVHGPEKIKELYSKNEDDVVSDDQSVQIDNHEPETRNSASNSHKNDRRLKSTKNAAKVVVDGRTSVNSTHGSGQSSPKTSSKHNSSHTSKDSKKSLKSQNPGGQSHNSSHNSSHTSRTSGGGGTSHSSHHSKTSVTSGGGGGGGGQQNSQDTSSSLSEEVNVGSELLTKDDIDEDQVLLNFTRARQNFQILGKSLDNKFIKRLKLEYSEEFGDDTISKLSDYSQINSFELVPVELELSKFGLEEPEGDLIHIRDGKLEPVYVKISKEELGDDQSQVSEEKVDADDESEHNDIDIFLTLENSQGAKVDDKMFLIIMMKNKVALEKEIGFEDSVSDFLNDEDIRAEQMRITFIDKENHLMSMPFYAKVVNHITTDEKFDSFDEEDVKLSFTTYQKFTPDITPKTLEATLDEYNKVDQVEIEVDPKLAAEAGDELGGGMEILEIMGSNTVLKIYISSQSNDRLLVI